MQRTMLEAFLTFALVGTLTAVLFRLLPWLTVAAVIAALLWGFNALRKDLPQAGAEMLAGLRALLGGGR